MDINKRYKLLTTTTCPKCPLIKSQLIEKIGGEMEVIDETSTDFEYYINKYNPYSAPTLIDEIDEKVISIDEILNNEM